MKHSVTIFTFFLCCSFSTTSLQQKTDLTLLCATKWHMSYMEVDGDKRDFASVSDEESWMIFHEDGEHEIMSIGVKYSGKWKYEEDTNELHLTDETGLTIQKIEKLTVKELILSFSFEGKKGKLFLINKEG